MNSLIRQQLTRTMLYAPRPINWARLLQRQACALLVCLSVVFVCCGAASVRAEIGQERSVKAAFLSKFVGYVDFPASETAGPNGPLTIGVLGADDVGADLTRILAGRTINGHPVTVRTLRAHDAIDDVNVLFIGGEESDHAERILRAASSAGILTVTEFDGGLRQGSVINFRLVDDRVRFEVSLPAAEKANLKLSSRLLSVAYLVQKGKP